MNLFHHYFFWLLMISLFVMTLEQIKPWRPQQKIIRELFFQDIFWLFFNGFFFGLLFNFILVFNQFFLFQLFQKITGLNPTFDLTKNLPFLLQVILSLIIIDFIEWCVHNLLHRINFLWKFHRVHHSIHVMDCIGNFRFHFIEIVFYHFFKIIPLALINGNRSDVVLTTAIISTLIGHLNHANFKNSWGIFKYILNSSEMHLWHHDKYSDKKCGYNFAVVFSLWDWIFKTAYMPPNQTPKALGFHKDEQFPDSLVKRFFLPFMNNKKIERNGISSF